MKEIWRNIKNYEGLYQVSNMGRIKSFHKYGGTNERILKLKIHYSYNRQRMDYNICLCKNGHAKSYSVARLVAEAFIPNPNNLPQVNHKNEFDTLNNSVENLEWCTAKYNTNYGTHNKRSAKNRKRKINQYDLNNNFMKTWDSELDIEKETGWFGTHITACCKEKQKTAYGYKWKYKYI